MKKVEKKFKFDEIIMKVNVKCFGFNNLQDFKNHEKCCLNSNGCLLKLQERKKNYQLLLKHFFS